MEFRDLKADEIDVRVGQVGDGWCSLLLYKDARVDMNILDETVGSERWQRKHYELKDNMYCSVGIYFDGIGWVWKDDCGSESNTEKEKGESSDSFKRACVNWGIGRELYTSPKIIPKCETFEDKGKMKIKNLTNFSLDFIEIKNKQIIGLEISVYNKSKKANEIIFSYGKKSKTPFEDLEKPLLEQAKEYRILRQDGSEVLLNSLSDEQLNKVVELYKDTDKRHILAMELLKERIKNADTE